MEDSYSSLDYTYSLSKISCMKSVWYAHVTFAFLVVAAGAGCLATRLCCKHMHAWFGRMYIICMLWCMGTALVIHNTGLPPAVLLSFVWVLGGLSVGWVLIKCHQSRTEAEAGRSLSVAHLAKLNDGVEFSSIMQELKSAVAAQKSFYARMLSCKAAHGALMFMSFINIFGRMFGVKLSDGFSCHTFPYYKQLDSPKFTGLARPLTPVPALDPNYSRLPWAHGLHWWGLELSLGPIAFALATGSLFVVYVEPWAARKWAAAPRIRFVVGDGRAYHWSTAASKPRAGA